MNKTFTPAVKLLNQFDGTATIAELDAETSVFAASPEFVQKNCGPIANRILDAVPQAYYDAAPEGMLPNIDIRVHRLNIGEYPAVPGWHCDGQLRETYFAAPKLDAVSIRDTVLSCVSTGMVSNFEIADEPFTCDTGEDDFCWSHVNQQIEQSNMRSFVSQDGQLYQMTIDTLHRCIPARVRGWRLFFRMSMWHNDYLGDGGKIARQQQVYITHARGW